MVFKKGIEAVFCPNVKRLKDLGQPIIVNLMKQSCKSKLNHPITIKWACRSKQEF
jgi:dihydroorotate dehydrogenase